MIPTALNNDKELDLENSSKEPIHIIGKTQPHGVLIACDPKSLKVTQIGENTSRFFGMAFEEISGKELSYLLGEKQVEELVNLLCGNYMQR